MHGDLSLQNKPNTHLTIAYQKWEGYNTGHVEDQLCLLMADTQLAIAATQIRRFNSIKLHPETTQHKITPEDTGFNLLCPSRKPADLHLLELFPEQGYFSEHGADLDIITVDFSVCEEDWTLPLNLLKKFHTTV